MVKGVFDELDRPTELRRRHVTVGIVDDVTHLSVAPDPGVPVSTTTRPGRCSTVSAATAPSAPARAR